MDMEPCYIVGIIFLGLILVLGMVLTASHIHNQDFIQCVEAVKHLNAIEIQAICERH